MTKLVSMHWFSIAWIMTSRKKCEKLFLDQYYTRNLHDMIDTLYNNWIDSIFQLTKRILLLLVESDRNAHTKHQTTTTIKKKQHFMNSSLDRLLEWHFVNIRPHLFAINKISDFVLGSKPCSMFSFSKVWDLQWAIKAVMNHHISQFIIEKNSIDCFEMSVCVCVCAHS